MPTARTKSTASKRGAVCVDCGEPQMRLARVNVRPHSGQSETRWSSFVRSLLDFVAVFLLCAAFWMPSISFLLSALP